MHRLARNAGSSAARNRGVLAASSGWVKFLDSDDVLSDGALAAEHRLALDSGADIVATGWADAVPGDGATWRIRRTFPAPVFGSIVDDILAGKAVPTSSALYRTELARAVRWDEGLVLLNDWDYFVRAALAARSIATCPLTAYEWRHHAGPRITTSGTFCDNSKAFYRILDRVESHLAAHGLLTPPRSRRLAQYLYKELRGMYRHEPATARTILNHIRVLDPAFAPVDEEPSAFMRAACRHLPIHFVLSGYGIARRAADRLRGPRAI